MVPSLVDVPRKALYRIAMSVRREAASELALMRRQQWLSTDEILGVQTARLERLLRYVTEHVPYYREVLGSSGVVDERGIHSERFTAVPLLDKAAIRENFSKLTSDEIDRLHATLNKTGGSTGEPLTVMQGRDEVRITGGAVLRFFYEWHGARPGDREVKLWGSTADLFAERRSARERLRTWASGFRPLNAFCMTPALMTEYVQTIDRFRPKVLRGYSTNLYELARFIEAQGLRLRPPGFAISSAGTLYPHMRETMERAFGCKVYDHYGSREMHTMAMECPSGGFHISALTHLVEVVDEEGHPCAPGVEGDLVITNLVNHAMPLIRYRIGDRGVLADGACPCGRGLPRLARISGRRVDCFWTRDGRMVPGEYFVHLLGVMLGPSLVSKFQVTQQDYDQLIVKMVLGAEPNSLDKLCREIEDKTRIVMGATCSIQFEVTDDIPPSPSGKYLYTVCRISGRSGFRAPVDADTTHRAAT